LSEEQILINTDAVFRTEYDSQTNEPVKIEQESLDLFGVLENLLFASFWSEKPDEIVANVNQEMLFCYCDAHVRLFGFFRLENSFAEYLFLRFLKPIVIFEYNNLFLRFDFN
jgi:hypothetical protein